MASSLVKKVKGIPMKIDPAQFCTIFFVYIKVTSWPNLLQTTKLKLVIFILQSGLYLTWVQWRCRGGFNYAEIFPQELKLKLEHQSTHSPWFFDFNTVDKKVYL